jgi:hypothetical protein
MTMSRSIILALGLLLAGCASAERLAQRDATRCTARGFEPNSADYKNCLAQLDNERSARIDARHREMVERSASPLR